MVRATLAYLFIGAYILLMAPVGMLWARVTGDGAILYRLARLCIRAAGWMCGVRVFVEGGENITPGMTYVFLSNHQGNFDAPVLMHAIPRDLKALIKMEMMRIPILSLVMKQVHFVPIDRLNPRSARTSIDLGARLLTEGNSFLAFPEGTRSRNGQLGEFKKGVFIMAIKARAPVIPITISGSSEIQPPGRYAVRPGSVRVIIHKAISTETMTLEDRDRLISLIRDAILSRLP